MPKLNVLTTRRRQVAELLVQAVPPAEIAAKLSQPPETVERDVRRLRRQWLRDRPSESETLRELELQKLDRVEREAWQAWERSKQEAAVTKVSHEEKKNKAERTTKEQFGDPRYLQVIKDCSDRRCRLLGLGADETVSQRAPAVYEVVIRDAEQARRILDFSEFEQSLVRNHQHRLESKPTENL